MVFFDNGSSSIPQGEPSKTTSMFWNVLAFIMVSITLLFACDNLQMKHLSRNSIHSDSFAEDVVFKPQHSPTETTAAPGLTPQSTGPDPQPVPNSPSARTNLDADKIAEEHGFNKKYPPFISITRNGDAEYYTYTPRGRPLSDDEKLELHNQWGQWRFDGQRPLLTEDFYQKYPNRDVPWEKFPENAWQTNKEYLSGFLPEALALVKRAQDAILAEYGQPSTGTWEERTKMFAIQRHPENFEGLQLTDRKGKAIIPENGGWTTPKSWEALKRRMLHAIMTEDSFVFAMGGHSSSAGHGNHFQQSYTLQVQWILEAVFARIGVRHQSRNFGNGGLGTVQHGMGSASVYGPDVDVLMWDSGMTEGNKGFQEIMHRQVLLGGLKVPILWTEAVDAAKFFHNVMGIPVGCPGSGKVGIIKGQNDLNTIQNDIPFAMQYMDCSSNINAVCKEHEYDGICWIDRPDFKPTKTQDDHPGGRAGWHPGNKHHQLKGRVLAFTFLQALREVLTLWNEASDFTLSDDQWHVSAEYEEARNKIQEHLDEGECNKSFEKHGLSDLCKLPMKARTEFTPRAYASLSSIRTLMPPEMLRQVNPSENSVYEGPDVFNPSLHPPKGAVDVLSIVETGPPFRPVLVPQYALDYYKKPLFETPPKVPVGKGVYLDTHASDYFCDGTVDSWCDRGKDQPCLLLHHNDGRNGIKFDGFSGWIVLNLPGVRHGLIVVKVETWHPKDFIPKTNGWKSINNEVETSHRSLRHSTTPDIVKVQHNATNNERQLKKSQPQPYCDQFQLDVAIDGIITSYNVTEFDALERRGHVDRVVETFVLLNDPHYTKGEEKEVETALRISGCGRQKTFNLNHVYWA
ncbi:hypothetical protein IV203_016069 [Nitzschia inconspicua]|uniref:Uncharacterized protein n=1 Tax=Nitzschia inconspicua TaxID=303405 RepID=A0A9K3KQF1_9STRA|nr:hypothetical protein IV203_016069 [Nitzschia inconspicua]